MSKKNGNIIYKDGNAYLNGKLIGIGFEEGEHIPRASDYKLPKKLDAKTKRLIETTSALTTAFAKARERNKEIERKRKMRVAAKTKHIVQQNGKLASGEVPLPKSSDYKLPKTLSKSRKEFIDISGKFFDVVRKSYKNETKDKE